MSYYDCGCDKQYIQADQPILRSSCKEHRRLATAEVGQALMDWAAFKPSPGRFSADYWMGYNEAQARIRDLEAQVTNESNLREENVQAQIAYKRRAELAEERCQELESQLQAAASTCTGEAGCKAYLHFDAHFSDPGWNNGYVFNTCGRTECVAEQKRLMERIRELELVLRKAVADPITPEYWAPQAKAILATSETHEIQAQEG